MWKLMVMGLLMAILCGCAQQESYETMMDAVVEPMQAERMVIMVNLPEEAAKQAVLSEESDSVYLCDNYTLAVQTLPGGNLQKTVLETTGFLPEQLSMIETAQAGAKRYVAVWTSAGEAGNQVGRCAILDDGSYHYVLSVMADEQDAGRLSEGVWKEIFASFRLIAPEDVVSSGS